MRYLNTLCYIYIRHSFHACAAAAAVMMSLCPPLQKPPSDPEEQLITPRISSW
jgi:hypothetical protein